MFTDTIEDLLYKIQEVFERLDSANLKLKAEKCHIGMTSVNYLGFIVDENGLRPSHEKVQAIKQMEAPRNVREIRRFLGMTSYYRNFIERFAHHANPLTSLVGKNARYHWSAECQGAFEHLKDALCKAPVLSHPDMSQPFAIFTDASDVGVGAVLAQSGQPVWFASRVLTPAERKYDTREKECIAVMFGLEKFKPYYYGRHVTVFTDHGNLRWLMDHEQKGRLARWQLYLQQYDVTISYVKGKHNPVADCLSRYEDTKVIVASVKVKQKLQAVVVPRKIRLPIKNWQKQQDRDPQLALLKNNVKLPFVLEDGILYRQKEDSQKKRLVLPEHLIQRFIEEAHNSSEAAHGGVNKTSYHLRSYWFSSFRKRIEAHCRQCGICIQAKGFGDRHSELSTREPMDILERVYVDVVGPLPNDTESYEDDARYILTMMDDGSRFLCAAPMRTCKRHEITECFRQHWIGVFGRPRVIVSDNNEQFKGEFLEMCKDNEILKEWTAPYSPEQNAVERVHKTLMDKVRALKFSLRRPWSVCLPMATQAYNISVQDSVGYAPYMLLFAKGKDIIAKESMDVHNVAQLRTHARTHAFQKRRERVDKINNTRKDEEIRVGDIVYVRNVQQGKLEPRTMEDPCTVVAIEAKNVLQLEASNGYRFRRSRKDVKKK